MRKQNTIKLMWKLILYRPWLYLLNAILWTFIHVAPIIPGLITREYINTLTGDSTLNLSIWIIILIFGMFALSRAAIILGGFFVDITHRFNIGSLLRRNLLNRILSLPGNKAIDCAPGEVITNFREDVEEIENSISWTLDVIGTLSFAIISILILFSISPDITLYVFLPIALVVFFAHLASKKVQKYRKAARVATAEVTSSIGEMFDSIQAVQVSASEEYIMNHFKELNKKRHKLMLKDTLFTQLLDSIMFNTVSIGTGIILLLCAESLKIGTFSVGDFSLFIYCLNFVADFAHFWGFFLAKYQQAGVSFNRLHEIMKDTYNEKLVSHHSLYLSSNAPKPVYEKLKDDEHLNTLEVKDLQFTYDDASAGISDINFTVKNGTFTVICGRIGSGKTTLLRVLLGLLPKQEGLITWNGKEITKPEDYFIYPRVAYTPQVPRLFSEEIKNNILLGLDEAEVNLDKAIYQAVLDDDMLQFDKGLETLIGPKGMKLSGGQIQRVAAARMFIRDSQLFVLDDISSALDVNTEKTLWNRLFEKVNKTCIVVSNKRIALQNADHIIVLKNGKIVSQGKLNELLTTCEEFKEIWN